MRKTKAQKQAELDAELQAEWAKQREEFYPRLFKDLAKCSEFKWPITFEQNRVVTGPDSSESVSLQFVENYFWELESLECVIGNGQARREEYDRKAKLRQNVWEKLSEDEREALGMRRK